MSHAPPNSAFGTVAQQDRCGIMLALSPLNQQQLTSESRQPRLQDSIRVAQTSQNTVLEARRGTSPPWNEPDHANQFSVIGFELITPVVRRAATSGFHGADAFIVWSGFPITGLLSPERVDGKSGGSLRRRKQPIDRHCTPPVILTVLLHDLNLLRLLVFPELGSCVARFTSTGQAAQNVLWETQNRIDWYNRSLIHVGDGA